FARAPARLSSRRNSQSRPARRLPGTLVRQRPCHERGPRVSQRRALLGENGALVGRGEKFCFSRLGCYRRTSPICVARQFLAGKNRQKGYRCVATPLFLVDKKDTHPRVYFFRGPRRRLFPRRRETAKRQPAAAGSAQGMVGFIDRIVPWPSKSF